MNTTKTENQSLLVRKLDELIAELKPWLKTDKAKALFNEIKKISSDTSSARTSNIGLSAQVSLYPLRTKSLSPCIHSALEIFKDIGLDISPGSMSTVIIGSDEKVWQGLQCAFAACSENTELVMTITVSNACPIPKKHKADEKNV